MVQEKKVNKCPLSSKTEIGQSLVLVLAAIHIVLTEDVELSQLIF